MSVNTRKTLTARERVEIALRGGHSDKVPFTMYEGKLPACTAEREMRNRGLCIVERSVPALKTHCPNVKITKEVFYEDGKEMVRTFYETPSGTLSTLDEPIGFTTWHHEKMFKSPEDYKAILFLIEDESYEPNYEAFALAQKLGGDDLIMRASMGSEPLQKLISSQIMKMETFCMEWMDNRDEVLKLYDAYVEKRRQVYPIVAQSPALHANYGGNVTPEVVGLENFEKYYVPHYNEAAEVMHEHGKLIGCHFDANCRLLSEAIAGTGLDFVEAFTAAPDTDMTLAEARSAWPDKVLWLNFPSSVHLKTDEEVEQATVALLNELDSVDGLIMGITEKIPDNRLRNSTRAIMDGLDRHAREKPDLYV